MGAFIDPKATVRIPVNSTEDWIDVKERMGFGDLLKIREVGYRIVITPEGEQSVETLLGEARLLSLQLNIIDWSFKDSAGNKVSITRQNLEFLDPGIAEMVLSEVDRLNAPKSLPAADRGGEEAQSPPLA